MALSSAEIRPIVINKTPGVQGGEACIGNTRIPVWGLVEYRNLGASDTEIRVHYPTLTQADLDAAWEYYRLHRAEIDEEIRLQESDDERA